MTDNQHCNKNHSLDFLYHIPLFYFIFLFLFFYFFMLVVILISICFCFFLQRFFTLFFVCNYGSDGTTKCYPKLRGKDHLFTQNACVTKKKITPISTLSQRNILFPGYGNNCHTNKTRPHKEF